MISRTRKHYIILFGCGYETQPTWQSFCFEFRDGAHNVGYAASESDELTAFIFQAKFYAYNLFRCSYYEANDELFGLLLKFQICITRVYAEWVRLNLIPISNALIRNGFDIQLGMWLLSRNIFFFIFIDFLWLRKILKNVIETFLLGNNAAALRTVFENHK